MKIAIIGTGAISTFVHHQLAIRGVEVVGFLVRQGKVNPQKCKLPHVSSFDDLPKNIDLLIDCAGYQGLVEHAIPALAAGINVLTLSLGALANKELEKIITEATQTGNTKLHLASGAIGALDALRAASVGSLRQVKYVGRKPARGWIGSPAEDKIDLENLSQAITHYQGSARQAAICYPKNANVAAAVALSSLGFDKTEVELIADPALSTNIHEIHASGDFGELRFSISGNSLSDNPRSSALAAMSVVSAILEDRKRTRF